MSRFKKFIEVDVLTESRKRMSHLYGVFDTVVVCFSGGKDSLVCLHLAWEEAQRRGQTEVNVIFRDEELIPNSVIDFVDGYRRRPWINLKWYCVPLQSEKFILGKRISYVQWDRDRQWVREKPAWGIEQPADQYRVMNQYNCDEYMTRDYKGSVALITGIRAAESLVRYRSVVNKLNENYICKAEGGLSRSRLCKPIFDWSEGDIFKYLGESGIAWCNLYDAQHITGNNLRVSTPLHAESAKRFSQWRKQDPDFYQRVIDVFPEMLVQDRYWGDYDASAIRLEYETDDLSGCRRYINEQIEDPKQKQAALKRLREFKMLRLRDTEAYPSELLLRALVRGSIKRKIIPLNKDQQKARHAKAKAKAGTSAGA